MDQTELTGQSFRRLGRVASTPRPWRTIAVAARPQSQLLTCSTCGTILSLYRLSFIRRWSLSESLLLHMSHRKGQKTERVRKSESHAAQGIRVPNPPPISF